MGNSGRKLAQFRLALSPGFVALVSQLVPFGDVFWDESLHDLGLHHVVAQRSEHLFLSSSTRTVRRLMRALAPSWSQRGSRFSPDARRAHREHADVVAPFADHAMTMSDKLNNAAIGDELPSVTFGPRPYYLKTSLKRSSPSMSHPPSYC